MKLKDFDAAKYISKIVSNSKYAKDNDFTFNLISGIQGAEDLVSNMKRQIAFVALDDTIEGETVIRENGPVERFMCTVFILRRYNVGKEESRIAALDFCDIMKKKILTWLLHDKEKLENAMIYLDEDIQERKVGTVLNGVTGLYFTFSFYRPTSLVFIDDDWDDPKMPI